MTPTGHAGRPLQRQILPHRPRHRRAAAVRRPRARPRLDADKYEIGANRARQGPQQRRDAAVDLDRRARSTPTRSRPRTASGSPLGERLSFGTYFNAFPARYWRRWTDRHRRHA